MRSAWSKRTCSAKILPFLTRLSACNTRNSRTHLLHPFDFGGHLGNPEHHPCSEFSLATIHCPAPVVSLVRSSSGSATHPLEHRSQTSWSHPTAFSWLGNRAPPEEYIPWMNIPQCLPSVLPAHSWPSLALARRIAEPATRHLRAQGPH